MFPLVNRRCGTSSELPFPKSLLGALRPGESSRLRVYYHGEVQGIELERVWPRTRIADRFILVKAIIGFQKAWTSVFFKKFGSLYYAPDLEEITGNEPLYVDANGVEVTDKFFAIGASTGRELTDNRRATIDFDRGPCKNSELRSWFT